MRSGFSFSQFFVTQIWILPVVVVHTPPLSSTTNEAAAKSQQCGPHSKYKSTEPRPTKHMSNAADPMHRTLNK